MAEEFEVKMYKIGRDILIADFDQFVNAMSSKPVYEVFHYQGRAAAAALMSICQEDIRIFESYLKKLNEEIMRKSSE